VGLVVVNLKDFARGGPKGPRTFRSGKRKVSILKNKWLAKKVLFLSRSVGIWIKIHLNPNYVDERHTKLDSMDSMYAVKTRVEVA
jgi:hypothetical protein